MARCPNGTRRNKKTGECVDKNMISSKRCPRGTRRNKKTGECVNNHDAKMVAKSKESKTIDNINFVYSDGYWLQKDGVLPIKYYDSDDGARLLKRLNTGADMAGFAIKGKNGDHDVYAPNKFTKVRMLKFEMDKKNYYRKTQTNDKNGFDAFFVLDRKANAWVQKTGENISRMFDNDNFELMTHLAKVGSAYYLKNKRGMTLE
jgi:hypothetical protein